MKGIKMLHQLHHQNKKDESKTKMVAQRDINSDDERKKFIEDTKISNSLPEDCVWLMVLEGSPFFKYSYEIRD